MELTRMSQKAAAAAILLSLALGITLGVPAGRRLSSREREGAAPTATPRAVGKEEARPAPPPPPARPPVRPLPPELASAPTGPRTLIDRLERLKKFLVEKAKLPSDANPLELYQTMSAEWPDLHQAALKDPLGFFAFLKAAGNEDLCEDLLDVLASAPRFGQYRMWMVEKLPPAVIEGIADLLSRGTTKQQVAAAGVARDLIGNATGGKEHALLQPCLALLSSDDPRAQAIALDVVRSQRPERLEESLELASSLLKKSDNPEVQVSCLTALARMQSPAAEQVFFERVAEAMHDHLGKASDPLSAPTLELVRDKILSSKPDAAERYGGLLLSSMQGTSDDMAFRTCARAALDLPATQAASILEQAAASAPSPETRSRVRAVLDKMQAGEVRPARLQPLLGVGLVDALH